MINLVPAICPCCGGQLELDDNMKKAICKYCNNTIIVDEAIEKFKTDSHGNLKISGIKDIDKYIEEANKYFKINEYKNAIARCNDIQSLDSFNDFAFIMKIKCFLGIIGDINEYEEKIKNEDYDSWVNGYAIQALNNKIDDYEITNHSKEYILKELGQENIDKIQKV